MTDRKSSLLLRATRAAALPLALATNGLIRALSRFTHRLQFLIEWGVRPHPEWFDTYVAQQYQWSANRTSWLWDRGVYNVLGMPADGRVLDICCGGGFFTKHFYSGRAKEVVAVDFDPKAIKHARRFNAAPNVQYELCDIRGALPQGPFDHVVWDGAIEHFTEDEMTRILFRIKAQMRRGAILSGYTIKDLGTEQHHDHEYEFKGKEDMLRVFQPVFKNVLVFETVYPDRHNLHFLMSDAALPFDKEWPTTLRSSVTPAGLVQAA